jgi:hypothetical protein
VALVVAMVVAALAYQQHSANTALNESLSAGRNNFAAVVTSLNRAHNVGQLNHAGTVASDHLGRLQGLTNSSTTSSQTLDAAVHAVLLEESRFTQAARGLTHLTTTDLTSWATLQPQLTMAATRYTSAVNTLRSTDRPAAAQQPNAASAISHVGNVVTQAMIVTAAGATTRLLQTITEAKTTSDVRDAAASALGLRDAVVAAQRSTRGSHSGTAALASLSRILSAVRSLGSVSADNLTVWDADRAPLAEALSAFPQDAAGYSALSSAGATALDHLDELVQRGTTAMRRWRRDLHTAIAGKTTDLQALQVYGDNMHAQISTYTSLRTDTSNFIGRIESGAYVTYHEAYLFLNGATSSRENVRSSITAMAVPAGLEAAHAELIAVLTRAINAMQAAVDGTRDAQWCGNCYWRNTPGWRTFTSESAAISQQYAAVLSEWGSTFTEVEQAVQSRSLPVKPSV